MGGESACGISRKTRVSARVRTRARRHLGRVAPQHSHRAGSHTDGHARASSSAPDSPKAASFYGFETTAPPRELLKDSAASFPRPRWKPSRCAPGLPACPSAPAVPAPPVPAGSAASPWVPALRCAPDRAIAAPPSLARDRPSHRGSFDAFCLALTPSPVPSAGSLRVQRQASHLRGRHQVHQGVHGAVPGGARPLPRSPPVRRDPSPPEEGFGPASKPQGISRSLRGRRRGSDRLGRPPRRANPALFNPSDPL